MYFNRNSALFEYYEYYKSDTRVIISIFVIELLRLLYTSTSTKAIYNSTNTISLIIVNITIVLVPVCKIDNGTSTYSCTMSIANTLVLV